MFSMLSSVFSWLPWLILLGVAGLVWKLWPTIQPKLGTRIPGLTAWARQHWKALALVAVGLIVTYAIYVKAGDALARWHLGRTPEMRELDAIRKGNAALQKKIQAQDQAIGAVLQEKDQTQEAVRAMSKEILRLRGVADAAGVASSAAEVRALEWRIRAEQASADVARLEDERRRLAPVQTTAEAAAALRRRWSRP